LLLSLKPLTRATHPLRWLDFTAILNKVKLC
jgi:hypothetical protein